MSAVISAIELTVTVLATSLIFLFDTPSIERQKFLSDHFFSILKNCWARRMYIDILGLV